MSDCRSSVRGKDSEIIAQMECNSSSSSDVWTEKQNFNISISDELIAWNINANESLKYLHSSIFLIVLLVIGLTGNSLVYYVYNYHFKTTTANLFIKVLAILDAICCVFGIPYELVCMLFPFLTAEPFSCKTLRTIERAAEVISGEMMLLIAYDRYLHVCKPFETYSYSKSRRLIYIAIFVGILISLPALVIIGIQEKEFNGVRLSQCYLDPVVESSKLVFVYFVSINITFLGTLLAIVLLYCRIWSVVFKWRHTTIGESCNVFATDLSRKSTIGREQSSINGISTDYTSTDVRSDSLREEGHISSKVISSSKNYKRQLDRRKMQSLRRKTIKPVIVLFAVTVAFIISFLPQFIINCLSTLHVMNMSTMPLFRRQWWEVAYKSYFLSNVVNPIIYATFDHRFRQKCFEILIQKGYHDRRCFRHFRR